MNRTDKVIEYFNSLPEVKRIHELEAFIDNNKEINDLYNEVKEIQRLMISSKEFNQLNQYKSYKSLYEEKKNNLLDYPFVEEYLELLDIVNLKLIEFTNIVEEELDNKIN